MLTRTEEIILLSVCRLGVEAVGLNIRKDVEEVTGRRHSVGGIYVPLERLVAKGYLSTQKEEGGGDRLGRPRKRFAVTGMGIKALSTVHQLNKALWSSIPDTVLKQLEMSGS